MKKQSKKKELIKKIRLQNEIGYKGVSPEFRKLVKEIMDENDDVFRELAKV